MSFTLASPPDAITGMDTAFAIFDVKSTLMPLFMPSREISVTTSAATPQVTSLAALILHKWPQLTGVDAGNIILATARDIGEPGVDPVFGHGLIDMRGALSPVNPDERQKAITHFPELVSPKSRAAILLL